MSRLPLFPTRMIGTRPDRPGGYAPRKAITALLLACLTATCLSVANATVAAAETLATPPAAPVLTATDTFDASGSTPAGWTANRGAWKTASGTLQLASGSAGIISRNSLTLGTSFSITADIGQTSANYTAWNGIATNVSSGATTTSDGYMNLRVRRTSPTNASWQVLRVVDGVINDSAVMAKGNISGTGSSPFRMTLSGNDGGAYSFKISQGQTAFVTSSIALPTSSTLIGGTPGITSSGGSITADYVAVTSTGSSVVDPFSGAQGAVGEKWAQTKGAWTRGATGATTTSADTEQLLTRSDVTLGGTFSISADVLPAASSSVRRWSGIAFNSDRGAGYYTLRFSPSTTSAAAAWELVRRAGDSESIEESGTVSTASTRAVTVSVRADRAGALHIGLRQGQSGLLDRDVELDPGALLTGGRAALYSQSESGVLTNFRLATNGTVPYSFVDEFARADSRSAGTRWQELRGDWQLSSGKAVLENSERVSSRRAVLVPVRPAAADLLFSSAAVLTPTPTTTTTWNGIVTNARTESSTNIRSTDSFYSLQVAAGTGTPNVGAWRFILNRDGSETVVATGPVPVQAGTAYTISLSQRRLDRPNEFVVSISAGSTVVLTDTAVTVPAATRLAGGLPGLLTYTGGAAFDSYSFAATSVAVGTSTPPTSLTYTSTANSSLSPYQPGVTATLDSAVVGKTFAGTSVQQAIVTSGTSQYVAYYDENRRMTVAKRSLPNGAFTYKTLDADPNSPTDTVIGWDTHNYLSLGVDEDGNIHLAGNMHASKLVYFKTNVPGDISTLTRVPTLVDSVKEASVTYPTFFTREARNGAPAVFVFAFRDGYSGNGEWIYYSYDNGTWTPLAQFFTSASASGSYSAYPVSVAPTVGPDNRFHLVWIWRDTEDAATNTRIGYAVSDDLITWETITGTKITGPISYDTPGVIVDDVPQRGGAINGLVNVGFDSVGKPIVTYSKFDDPSLASGPDGYAKGPGSNQIFAARHSATSGKWEVKQLSNWYGRWAPGGSGTLIFPMSIGAPSPVPGMSGVLQIPYTYAGKGQNWLVDEKTLDVLYEASRKWITPSSLPMASAEMKWYVANDSGKPQSDGTNYVLLWTAYAGNNDRDTGRVDSPQNLVIYHTR